jgi:hypothetical protein
MKLTPVFLLQALQRDPRSAQQLGVMTRRMIRTPQDKIWIGSGSDQERLRVFVEPQDIQRAAT